LGEFERSARCGEGKVRRGGSGERGNERKEGEEEERERRDVKSCTVQRINDYL